MSYTNFVLGMLICNLLRAEWQPVDIGMVNFGAIHHIALRNKQQCYIITTTPEDQSQRLYYRHEQSWKKAPELPDTIMAMHIDRDSLFLLTQSEPQQVVRFFNDQFSPLYSFSAQQSILNFVPYGQDILIINHGVIRIMNAPTQNIWNLSTILNVSDLALDTNNSLWAIQKEIIGQGRQTTLFIKLKEWNQQTQQWRLHTQQVGPRIFRLANGRSPDLWSLQGDSPQQLFAYRFDKQADRWRMQGTLKGFKLLATAQDGTVWAVHHNNTIYEWREN